MEFPSRMSYIKLNLTDGNRMKASALNMSLTSEEGSSFGMLRDRGKCPSENGRASWSEAG